MTNLRTLLAATLAMLALAACGGDTSTTADAGVDDPDAAPDAEPDPDRDGDGWSNTDETACGSDLDDDGSLPPDGDGDLACDALDDDDDGDGALDAVDAFPLDPAEQTDTDSDGTGDNADDDDDGDSWSDADEIICGTDPRNDDARPVDLDHDHLCDIVVDDVVVTTRAAAGAEHACAIDDAGLLSCWGQNTSGQAGEVGTVRTVTPTQVGIDSDWASVSAGDSHSCAIKTSGALFCWGSSYLGRLGTGTATGPVPVQVGVDADWRVVAAGGDHTCGVKLTGELYCWGSNLYGQVGDPTSVGGQVAAPLRVGTDDDWIAVVAAWQHSCGLRSTGQLSCWGRNIFGTLGNGTTVDSVTPTAVTVTAEWASLAAGSTHTCAIDGEGHLYCWGYGGAGQLGNGTTQGAHPDPVEIGTTQIWRGLEAGSSHSCALDGGGALWCWGSNGSGQLGDGSTVSRSTPGVVGVDTDWTALFVGGGHSCAFKASGALWCWGRNNHAQIGTGVSADKASPVTIGTGTNWGILSGGISSTCGTRGAGNLRCWGTGDSGQLGLGALLNHDTPQLLATLSASAHVAVGSGHACAIATDGTLRCWGSNDHGKLGIDSASPAASTSPVQVGVATNWIAIAAADHHTCGIQLGGALSCWGWNQSGEIGNGAITDVLAPAQLAGTWSAVTTGADHTCALSSTGTLYCWGKNDEGQLGDPSSLGDEVAAPLQIGSAQWASVAAGSQHTCAIDAVGNLSCWGDNQDGELGDGTQLERPAPVPIAAGTAWAMVAMGGGHTCGLTTAGTLHCWGGNEWGQLGLGLALSERRLTPTQIGVATNWDELASGWAHTCAVAAGVLSCWGRNDTGQLGDGTAFYETPTAALLP